MLGPSLGMTLQPRYEWFGGGRVETAESQALRSMAPQLLARKTKMRELRSMERQAGLQREHEARMARESFERKAGFARPFLEQAMTPLEPEGPEELSESEKILIQAQKEAGEEEINRLQDVLAGAGILSSGTLAVGTGQILGKARAGVARTAAEFAEARRTRRHQELLARRQQLVNLIQSILA